MMNAMKALEEYKNKGERVDEVLFQIVKAELNSMQNALRFYANDDTYKTQWITRNLTDTADQLRATTAIREDLGRRARQALKGSVICDYEGV